MGGGQMETPARGQAQPGQDSRLAIAAGTCKVAQPKGCAKATFAATLDPATLAAFGLAGARIWEALA